jgi:hypothetical protein
MELQELQALLAELMQAIQEVMQSGEVLSDEFQAQLAQTLQLLYSRMEELERVTGGPGIPNPPEPPPPGMPSSNVKGTSYDENTGDLQVQFLGKHPNSEGPRYIYKDTPPQIAQLVQSGAIPARSNGKNKWGDWWKGKVPSAGASVFTLLKETGVPYQKISG